jgi:hypothetical protein
VNVQYFEDVRKIPKTDCPIPDRAGTSSDRPRLEIAANMAILSGIRIAHYLPSDGLDPAHESRELPVFSEGYSWERRP